MRSAVIVLILLASVAVGFAQSKQSTDKSVVPTLPSTTPFDGDSEKRAVHLRYFVYGFEWAQGIRAKCLINPLPENMHAVRGWIEGWQAAVAVVGERGGCELPGRFAPYVAWREPKPGSPPDPVAPSKEPSQSAPR